MSHFYPHFLRGRGVGVFHTKPRFLGVGGWGKPPNDTPPPNRCGALSRTCALPLKRLFRCFNVGPMVNFSVETCYDLEILSSNMDFAVISRHSNFCNAPYFLLNIILFSVLYLYFWRKSSEMSSISRR